MLLLSENLAVLQQKEPPRTPQPTALYRAEATPIKLRYLAQICQVHLLTDRLSCRKHLLNLLKARDHRLENVTAAQAQFQLPSVQTAVPRRQNQPRQGQVFKRAWNLPSILAKVLPGLLAQGSSPQWTFRSTWPRAFTMCPSCMAQKYDRSTK
jgi:hypothetical protein